MCVENKKNTIMEDRKKSFYIGLMPTQETKERLYAVAAQVQETFGIENRF